MNFKILYGSIVLIIVLAISSVFIKYTPEMNCVFTTCSADNSKNQRRDLLEKQDMLIDRDITMNVNRPYDAPEIQGIESWINSNGEDLSALKGKVVLIDFWTYSCINCIRTLPHITEWYKKYKDDGLVIIGVHSPEFAFEKVKSNVENAVKEKGITYPVALDNNFATWKAYSNQYWPAEYFIDRAGKVRHTHFGEGGYSENERIIQALLREGGSILNEQISDTNNEVPVVRGQSPETYLGYERATGFANADEFVADKDIQYTLIEELDSHQWSLGGMWNIGPEYSVSESEVTYLNYKFSAKEVYLVMGSDTEKEVGVSIDHQNIIQKGWAGDDINKKGSLSVKEYRLYRIVKASEFTSNHILTLTIPKGVKIHAFTFGS